MTHRFTLISRGYCHLCDVMLDALSAQLQGHDAEVEVLDVDADEALLARYDELVPVLLDADGRELCHYHLDAPAVAGYLATPGNGA